ncbi:hypothetical protein K501DRAFT_175079 [Backusella circina FSU 941]|nr:hypothetical protein K501DRAFT_175079 [Backusella circina FSU 941]
MAGDFKEGVANASRNSQDEIANAAHRAEDEINRLKSELSDLKARAGPKIREAENFLSSPKACSFYQGVVTGIALVLLYKKYIVKE